MSADKASNETAAPSGDQTGPAKRSAKDRLKAMQAKHVPPQQPAKAAQAQGQAAAGGATGAGLMADLQAAMASGQGGAGGRAGILQKVQQVLSGPDGRIDPQRARMALMFVRKQASDPSAPRHDLAKKIEGMVRNLPPQQRQRLMAAAGMGGGAGGGFNLAGGARPGAAKNS